MPLLITLYHLSRGLSGRAARWSWRRRPHAECLLPRWGPAGPGDRCPLPFAPCPPAAGANLRTLVDALPEPKLETESGKGRVALGSWAHVCAARTLNFPTYRMGATLVPPSKGFCEDAGGAPM